MRTSTEHHHFPPEVVNLVVECLPLLCRSKQQVLDFFRSAGTPESMLQDLQATVRSHREKVTKYSLVRTVVQRLNEVESNRLLAVRRTLLHRITTFEDFSSCWPEDQFKAKGVVADLRRVVNVKDSFSKLQQQQTLARTQRMREQLQQRERFKTRIDEAKNEVFALAALDDPSLRGRAFEKWLNELFALYSISIRKSFRRSLPSGAPLEQIDGVVEIDSHLYLVEAKWTTAKMSKPEIGEHLVRLYHRADSRAIIFSSSGFSEAAIETCRDALSQRVVTLVELTELFNLLESYGDLSSMLREKIHRAQIEKEPL